MRILLLFLILITGAAAAQDTPKQIRSLTVADGLPQSFISGIVQDKRGFIWIGTRNGLARYDGTNFKRFQHIPFDERTIAQNAIRGLGIDDQGNIWVQYDNAAVDLIKEGSEELIHISEKPEFSFLGIGFWVGFQFDKDAEGRSWIQAGKGDWRTFDLNSSKRVVKYKPEAFGFDSAANFIKALPRHLLVQWKGELWKVSSYDKADRRRIGQLNDPVFFTFRRSNGEVLICTNTEIYLLSARLDKLVLLKRARAVELTEDKNGNLYVIANNDVYRLEQGVLQKVIKSEDHWGPKSMLFDRSGLLWIGSTGGGIRLFGNERLIPAARYQSGFMADLLGKLPGKAFVNPYMNRPFSAPGGKRGLLCAGTSVIRYYAGEGLQDAGWKWDRKGGKSITAITTTSSGRMWGLDDHLNLLEFDDISRRVITRHTSLPRPSGVTITGIVADGEDRLIAGSEVYGLFLYDIPTRTYKQLRAGRKRGSLPVDNLTNFVQDKADSIIWMGSVGGGLIRYNKRSGYFRCFTTANGLPDNTVYAMVRDDKGSLWCSSNYGIFSFDPQSKKIITYTEKDGLPSNEFNRFHYLQLVNGRIAFGGSEGYAIIDPKNLRPDDFDVPLALTGFRINNRDVFDSLKVNLTTGKRELWLSHDENSLVAEFAGFQFNAAGKIKYRYRLSGYENEWVYTQRGMATYTNLPPGSYLLELVAANTSGKWSKDTQRIRVTIAPPFWKTWWFITVCFVAVAVAGWTWFQRSLMRVRREEQQKRKFEREVVRLEEQALRAQMDPHFIFNCLNAIKMLIQDGAREQAVTYLTTFAKLIRNQLTQSDRPNTLQTEIEIVKMYVKLEKLRYGEKLQCYFNIDPTLDLSAVQTPQMILQPLVENAIWHGILPKEHGGTINITIRQERERVVCEMTDNGIGREASKAHRMATHQSKGIELVASRLSLHTHITGLQSNIEIADLADQAGHAAGTRVVVWFEMN